jgi:outer membrane lipoprotein-sorting protein
MTDPLDRAAAALRDTPVPPGPPPDLTAATLAALAAADATLATRRRRMKLVRAVGATAALAAAVTLAVVLGTGSPASALQAAVEKAKNAKSVKFVSVLVVKHPEMEPQTTTVYWQGSKVRFEAAGHVRVADYAANRGVFLYPDEKYAWRLKNVEKMEPPLAQYTRFVNTRGARDGTDEIGGVKADRYRLRLERKEDPQDYRLWVDPRTGWPVKLEATGTVLLPDGTGKESPAPYTLTDDRYEWDVPLDAKLFDLGVPAGWEAGDGPPELRPRQK